MDMMQVKKTVSKNVAALLVMGMAVTTVSYTHLDVYKRQA